MLSFAAPALLFGLLSLPLVVWLHRRRARRERRAWAGTFLWRRAREHGASRPRLRRSLLLALQLLAVTALVLAAAQPRWNAPGPPLRVLVIDAGASMAARDGASSEAARDSGVASDATRTDVAFVVARELANDGGPVAVIRGGFQPRLALPPSDDASALADLSAAWTPGDARSDLERALVLARDVAAAHDGPAELHWLADRPPPSSAGVHLHPLAGDGRNVGITGFERVAGQAWVRVSSTWPLPVEVPLEVLRDGSVVASTTLVVPGGGDAAGSFPVGDGPGGPAPLQARIAPPAGDALDLDDVAWAPSNAVTVLLDRRFDALERALFAVPGVDVRVVAPSAARSLPADLRVLHDPSFAPAPEGATVLLPDRTGPAVGVRTWRWDRTDPLLRFVDLRDLLVARPDPAPFDEAPGWTTLAYGLPDDARDDAADAPVPLLQTRAREEGFVARFAFHPVRGDLTLRPAFPTLVVNLIDAVRDRQRVQLGEALPGTGPSEGAGGAGAGDGGARAARPGPVTVGDRTLYASLLEEDATRIPGPGAFSADTPRVPSVAPTAAAAGPDGDGVATPAGRAGGGDAEVDLLPWLLALAVALLAAEWWGHAHGFARPGWRWPAFGRHRDDPRGW